MIKSNKPKMARYSMAEPIADVHSPIHWDNEEFNLGIIYNNGVITIDQPGYYRITAAVFNSIRTGSWSYYIVVYAKIDIYTSGVRQ